MRTATRPRYLMLSCAALLVVGMVILIPDATAAPPMCDGKPATIVGTNGNDVLHGTGKDDVIVASFGRDVVYAGAGDDTICGDDGDDKLVGGPGDDVIIGGDGADTVGYGNAPWRPGDPSGVEIDLAGATATGHGTDTLVGVENVIGSAYRDWIKGDHLPNVIWGGSGSDWIEGRGGNDILHGRRTSPPQRQPPGVTSAHADGRSRWSRGEHRGGKPSRQGIRRLPCLHHRPRAVHLDRQHLESLVQGWPLLIWQ